MLTLVIIPLVAVLAIVVLCAVLLAARGHRVAAARADADRWRSDVERRNQQAEQTLIEAIDGGRSLDQSLLTYQQQRAQALPNAPLERSWSWDADDLQRAYELRLADGVADVQRRLALGGNITGAFIVIAAVVSTTIVYQFLSAPVAAPQLAGPESPAQRFPVDDLLAMPLDSPSTFVDSSQPTADSSQPIVADEASLLPTDLAPDAADNLEPDPTDTEK